jgi:hypothetical protein
MRASRHLTLPVHSLVFSNYETTNVRIIPDIEGYEDWWELRHRLNGYPSDIDANFYQRGLNVHLSVHPHISADGTPCLGDFGRAWSSAIISGNIGMLVNVCTGFLNTWTRRDCYWDINDNHRGYQQSGQMQGRRGMSFKRWLYVSKMAIATAHDLGHNLIMRVFNQWMSQNDTQERLEALGITWEKALMAFTVYKSTLKYVFDTEDEDVKRMKSWHNKIQWLYTDTMISTLDEFTHRHKMNAFAWAEEAFTGVKFTGYDQFGPDKVFSVENAFNDMDYDLTQYKHNDNNHYPSIEVVLNAKSRVYRNPTNMNTKLYMSNQDVNVLVGQWVLRNSGKSRPLRTNLFSVIHFMWQLREFGNLFKQAVEPFNPNQLMGSWIDIRNTDSISGREKRELLGEQYRIIISQMGVVLDNYDTTSLKLEFRGKFQVIALELFQEHLKALYKGVSDDKHSKRIDAYGESTGPDSPENQLSLDSF